LSSRWKVLIGLSLQQLLCQRETLLKDAFSFRPILLGALAAGFRHLQPLGKALDLGCQLNLTRPRQIQFSRALSLLLHGGEVERSVTLNNAAYLEVLIV
jgi:hypothetical protein